MLGEEEKEQSRRRKARGERGGGRASKRCEVVRRNRIGAVRKDEEGAGIAEEKEDTPPELLWCSVHSYITMSI